MLKLAVAVVKVDIIWDLLIKHIDAKHNNGYFTSLPIIRKENGLYYLTCFVSDLSTMRVLNGQKVIRRPTEWISASLQRGDELVYNHCSVIDFIDSNAFEYLPIYSIAGDAIGLTNRCLTEVQNIQTKIYSNQPYNFTVINNIIKNNVTKYYKPYYYALEGELNEYGND